MIVVTGAYGFIGSCLVGTLNRAGYRDLCVVDDFSADRKKHNLEGKEIREWIRRDIYLPWFRKSPAGIDLVFHIGARTDTTSTDEALFDRLNLEYSKSIWRICADHDIPLIYASSAATYGDGRAGYSDAHSVVPGLRPQNAYARSKQNFDLWALAQEERPPKWAGLKFFNVFGPNEYHKGRMASVVMQAFHQIRETGKMKLFRSHRTDVPDGQQARDFIYVMDVMDVCLFLMEHPFESGLYNVGTGKARTFLDLTGAVFHGLGLEPEIEFIDTPEDIRESYQYFTQAEMGKLRGIGYDKSFRPLEAAVVEFVLEYLVPGRYL